MIENPVTPPLRPPTAAPSHLVLHDRESSDKDVVVRDSLFCDRLVIAVRWGEESDDEEDDTAGAAAVALDPEDEARLLAYLTARAEARR